MPRPRPSTSPVGQSAVSTERVVGAVLLLRGQRVLLDSSLAELYEVGTKTLVRAMKRNAARFPDDFAFQLTRQEFERLRYQSGTSKARGGRRYLPFAFTEQGVAMPSSVLNSTRAVRVNIEIMRAFVRQVVFEAIRELMTPPGPEPKRIGFTTESRHRPRGLKSRLGKGTP